MRTLILFILFGLSFSLSAQSLKSERKVDEMPRFSSCYDQNMTKQELRECAQDAFLKYIYDNVKYPSIAKENKTEGKVLISFTITKYGRIENARIEKDLADNCGQAALEALLSLNNMDQPFFPGKSNGKVVAVEMVLPVNFAL